MKFLCKYAVAYYVRLHITGFKYDSVFQTNRAVSLLRSALIEPRLSVELTESESCVLLAALAVLERDQIRLGKKACDENRFKKARYRVETARKCLDLPEMIELAAEGSL